MSSSNSTLLSILDQGTWTLNVEDLICYVYESNCTVLYKQPLKKTYWPKKGFFVNKGSYKPIKNWKGIN